jgi:MtN3 and saliva related transmembrane protein
MNEVVGWLSSLILILTISTQLRKQWRSRNSHGVSKWLYIGQIAASLGFVYYSAASRNWVFVVTNALLGLEAMFGLGLVYVQRRAARRQQKPEPASLADSSSARVEPRAALTERTPA